MLLLRPYGLSPKLTAQLHGECPQAWHFDTGATLTNSWSFHLLLHCLLPATPALADCMKRMGGKADRSAVRLGAADRGLCGWQTPTKREGRGGAFHWQNTWASFLGSFHTGGCGYLAPCPTPTPTHAPSPCLQYTPSWEGLSVWCWRGGGVITAQRRHYKGVVTRWMCLNVKGSVIQCGFFFFFNYYLLTRCNVNFHCLNRPHLWERNAILSETNYFIV